MKKRRSTKQSQSNSPIITFQSRKKCSTGMTDIHTQNKEVAAAPSSRRSMRGSLFMRAKSSFVRSGGNRGASVETLRGTTGAVFESAARVSRESNGITLCGWCCSSGDQLKPCYILIKGPACFVFSSENAPSPKYAIPLNGKRAVETDIHEHHATVIIQDALGDPEYKLVFDLNQEKELASRFVRAVSNQSVVSHMIHEKKRLGHPVNLRASTMYASDIANKKEKDQPEKPVSAVDVLQNIPTAY